MATIFLAAAVFGLIVLCLAYRPHIRMLRRAGSDLLDANPRAGFYIYTVLSGTAMGFALVAFAKAQLPQLTSLLLFALGTNPSVKLRNPWPILQRTAGAGSALLGLYTVIVTGSILASCLRASEPRDGNDYLDFWRLMGFASELQRFIDFVGGVFRGYLLGDLDIFSSGPEPVFRSWTFSPMSDCQGH